MKANYYIQTIQSHHILHSNWFDNHRHLVCQLLNDITTLFLLYLKEQPSTNYNIFITKQENKVNKANVILISSHKIHSVQCVIV